MNKVQLEQEIGNCSEILSLAVRLVSPRMRNALMMHIGDYRTDLRMKLYELELETQKE